MPNIRQQKKRVRTAAKQRLENLHYRSTAPPHAERSTGTPPHAGRRRRLGWSLASPRTRDPHIAKGRSVSQAKPTYAEANRCGSKQSPTVYGARGLGPHAFRAKAVSTA
jgi:hypothetical protein